MHGNGSPIKHQEAELSAHIHHLLGRYVQQHLTTDYVEFTRLAVDELIYREKVPLQDPQSLTLPTDPFQSFCAHHKIQSLEPLTEKLVITRDTQTLLKDVLHKSKGKPRTERIDFSRIAQYPDDDEFERFEPILTRKAKRETPKIGARMERTEHGRFVCPLPQTTAKTYSSFLADKFEPVPVEFVQEEQVNGDKILDVVFQLRSEEEQGVRSLLKSVSAMRCPPKRQHIAHISDQRRSYLPARLQPLPEPLTEAPTPPDSPPLMPLFPRNQVTDIRSVKRQRSLGNGLPLVPDSITELPAILGVPPAKEPKFFPDGDEFSAEEMYKQNMMVVDGWATIATSSPSPPPSLDGDEDNIDQLLEMFPSSPNTSVYLAEEIENCKMEPVLIPRSRCIGGNLSSEREDSARWTDVSSFLASLLGEKGDLELARHHPVLSRELQSHVPKQTERKMDLAAENEVIPNIDDVDNTEAGSMLGQPAFSISETLQPSYMSTKMDCDLDEDEEIRQLYAPSATEPARGLDSPMKYIDAMDIIRNETLHDEETPAKQPVSIGAENETILRIDLLPVPLLPEPTSDIGNRLPKNLPDLLVTSAESEPQLSVYSQLRFLKKIKGLAPLRVSLSWVPFTVNNPPPSHGQLLQIDSVYDEERPELLFKPPVEQLLKTVTETVEKHDPEERFLRSLREMSLQKEEGAPLEKEFSSEIARCGLLMTRAERWRLQGLGGEAMEEEEEEANQPGDDVLVADKTRSNSSEALPLDTALEGSHDTEGRTHFKLNSQPLESVSDVGPGQSQQVGGASYYAEMYEDNTMVDPNPVSSSTIATDVEDGYPLGSKAALPFVTFDDNIENDFAKSEQFPILTQKTQLDKYTHHFVDRVTDAEDALDDQDFTLHIPADRHLSPQLQETRQVALPASSSWSRNPQNCYPSDISTKPIASKTNNQAHHSPVLTNYLTSQTNQACSLELFAKMRAKTITHVGEPAQDPQVNTSNQPPPVQAGDRIEGPQATSPLSRSCPPELIDATTLQLPDTGISPSTIHKYMASLDLLQKRTVVKAFQTPECQIELVERDTLANVDLIIDPFTAVIFVPLLSLPAHAKDVLTRLTAETWRYLRVLIIFEAYPSSLSFKDTSRSRAGLDPREQVQPQVYAYTPPILKAVKKFRRDVGIAEACGKKSSQCDIWYAFADSVGEAAAYARVFGDCAEESDTTEGALWGARQWLDFEPAEEEASLALFNGMNHLSASIILCQVSFEQLLGLSAQERLDQFAPYIGADAVVMLNDEIQQRLHLMDDLEGIDSELMSI